MNPQQTKYLKERIDGIVQRKLSEIKKRYPDERLKFDEIKDALRRGDYTIKQDAKEDYWGRTDIRSFIAFNEVNNSEIRQAKENQIRAESQLLMDRVMLEGEGVAEALARFADKEF